MAKRRSGRGAKASAGQVREETSSTNRERDAAPASPDKGSTAPDRRAEERTGSDLSGSSAAAGEKSGEKSGAGADGGKAPPQSGGGGSSNLPPGERGGFRGWVDDLFGLDLRTLAIVRIVVAIAVLGNVFLFWQDAMAFFSDAGIYPRSYWIERTTNKYMASVHLMSGRVGWIHFLFVLKAIFGLMLLFGWRTRLATLMTWALYLSLINRNVVLSHAGDSLLLLLLLWGFFTPWGGRFSVDAALNTVRDETPRFVLTIATAALLLQTPLVYFFSVLVKLSNESWHTDFSATYYAMSPEFVTTLGRWIAAVQPYWVTQALTINTLFWELVGSLLVLIPAIFIARQSLRRRVLLWSRSAAFVGITLFQLGLLLTMAIGYFPIISTAGLLPLVVPEVWNRLSKRARVVRAGQVTLWYDTDCGFCRKLVLILREFLLPQGARVRPGEQDARVEATIARENSWVFEDADGVHHLRFAGIIALVAASPVFFWLAPVLRWGPFAAIGDMCYRFIARRRRFFSRLTEPLVERPYRTKLPVLLAVAATVLVAYAPFSFLRGVEAIELPRELRQAQYAFRMSQSWRMFRRPIKWSSYYVIEATLADGRQVDLFGARGRIHPDAASELTWAPPEVMQASSFWANFRWRRYLANYRQQDHRDYRLYYGRYACRMWNGHYSGDDRLHRFRVYRMVLTRDLMLEPFAEEPERRLLWRHWCYGRPANDDDETEEEDDEQEESEQRTERSTQPSPSRTGAGDSGPRVLQVDRSALQRAARDRPPVVSDEEAQQREAEEE